MASLADINIPTAEVEIPGSDSALTVRGLAPEDLYRAHEEYPDTIEGLFAWYSDRGDGSAIADVVKHVFAKAPEFSAFLIALANDAPENVALARRLPTMVQIRALIEISRLTFHSMAEVKKILEDFTTGMSQMTTTVEQRTSTLSNGMLPEDEIESPISPPPLANGSGDSENTSASA